MRFDGKVAIITGGTSGIGLAAAERLASEGARVFAAGRREMEPHCDKRISMHQLDVADELAVAAFVQQVADEAGHIDVLVNNAGFAGRQQARLHELDYETWDEVFAVNTRGAFAMIKAVVPHMLRAGGGSIINVASVGSFRAKAMSGAYVSSKGAMMMLTKAAAVDYALDNIRVNAVCPSATATEMLEHLPADVLQQMAARHPQQRLGKPEEIAALIAFLASDEAPHITGAPYLIDGGRCAT